MVYSRFFNSKMLVFIPVLLLLIVAVACGDEATPTPQPTATPTSVPATATPVPATATPVPKGEPTPTEKAVAKATSTPTAKPEPTPTPAPAFFTSTVDRLLVATNPVLTENNFPWKQNDLWQVRPWAEGLMQIHPITGKIIPRLANAWEMRPDGKQWTITLNEGIPFHKGWGTFTNKDVKYNWLRFYADDATSADATLLPRLIPDPETNVELEGDYTVVLNLVVVEPDMDWNLGVSTAGRFVLLSKAQLEEGGDALVEKDAAGTGPFEFVSRTLGQNILYKRVENHWRKTPEFKELMFHFVGEPATRLAMALAGETHMASLPRDLTDQAASQAGWARTTASISGTGFVYGYGGLYYHTGGTVDPDNPFLNLKVREAMARAVNVPEIIDTLFQGRARYAVSQYFHPAMQGWDEEFPALIEELYGYDLPKAKALMAEAGYADGFKTIMHDTVWVFSPALNLVNEAVATYLREINIDVELAPVEWGSVVSPMLRAHAAHGRIQPFPGFGLKAPAIGSKLEHDARNPDKPQWVLYSHDDLNDIYDQLDITVDRAERERLQREFGRHLIENYAMIPTVNVPAEFVFDPDVIESYTVHGLHGGTFTDMAETKATR